jgi:hypothetical protein
MAPPFLPGPCKHPPTHARWCTNTDRPHPDDVDTALGIHLLLPLLRQRCGQLLCHWPHCCCLPFQHPHPPMGALPAASCACRAMLPWCCCNHTATVGHITVGILQGIMMAFSAPPGVCASFAMLAASLLLLVDALKPGSGGWLLLDSGTPSAAQMTILSAAPASFHSCRHPR